MARKAHSVFEVSNISFSHKKNFLSMREAREDAREAADELGESMRITNATIGEPRYLLEVVEPSRKGESR